MLTNDGRTQDDDIRLTGSVNRINGQIVCFYTHVKEIYKNLLVKITYTYIPWYSTISFFPPKYVHNLYT